MVNAMCYHVPCTYVKLCNVVKIVNERRPLHWAQSSRIFKKHSELNNLNTPKIDDIISEQPHINRSKTN
jgi:hypothetical protein